MFAPEQQMQLPKLRQDIKLARGAPEPDGTPTWTLYDPVSHKYYKIGVLEFECLARFSKYSAPQDLVDAVIAETGIDVDLEIIQELAEFLSRNQLLETTTQNQINILKNIKDGQKTNVFNKAIKSYLFFMVPLFRSQKFLDKTYPYVAPLFTRGFFLIICALFVVGVLMTLQRMDEFFSTFMYYFNVEGVVLMALTVAGVKVCHELGHAYMATKFGVRVPVIGVAFILMYPILYTETTGVWELENRRHRLLIALAGILVEFSIATFALLLWNIVPPGPVQSAAFFVSLVSLIGSLFVNLNPLMKFDGYYIMSDAFQIDNLQSKAITWARWRLRKVLWGLGDPEPELRDDKTKSFLQVLGTSLLLYRFVLYIGIAIMVYLVFPKPLGPVLMFVELFAFIFMPAWSELKFWWVHRERIWAQMQARTILFSLGAVLALFILPVHRTIEIPVVMHSAEYEFLFPTAASKIISVNVKSGDAVKEGDVLMQLESPSLAYEIGLVREELRSLRLLKQTEQAVPELSSRRLDLDEQIAREQARLQGLLKSQQKLEIKASFDGLVVDIPAEVKPLNWVDQTQLLGVVIDPSKAGFSGYLGEDMLKYLKTGQKGAFYPDYAFWGKGDVEVVKVDQTVSDILLWPELSSVFGGPVPADPSQQSPRFTVPHGSFYKVSFKNTGKNNGLAGFEQNDAVPNVQRGVIRVAGSWHSPFWAFLKRSIALILREINI